MAAAREKSTDKISLFTNHKKLSAGQETQVYRQTTGVKDPTYSSLFTNMFLNTHSNYLFRNYSMENKYYSPGRGESGQTTIPETLKVFNRFLHICV